MPRAKPDPEREERITMEIVVDAYDAEEQAMGWHAYLEDTMQFPFTAKCVNKRGTSPLKVGQSLTVLGMADSEDCEREMFVLIEWNAEDHLAIPLAQIKTVDADNETEEAIADWHYWVSQGYEFG
jgi:hypothetical protein